MTDAPPPDNSPESATSQSKPAPPPSEYPLNSLEYFWDRIVLGYLTDDDAAAMWDFIVNAARAARKEFVDDPVTRSSGPDFKEAVIDINARGDPHERIVLAMLVQGDVDEAARRCQAIVDNAGKSLDEKLWFKGALFAPTAPDHAREAWLRLLQIRPDFHHLRCAFGKVLERLGETKAAEAAYQAVVIGSGGDKAMEARAVDCLADMATARDDIEGAIHFRERSLQLQRELGDLQEVYWTLMELGSLAVKREELVLAESYVRQALEVAGQRTDAADVLSAIELLALVAEMRGDFSAAQDAVRNALGLHEFRKDKPAMAADYQRLGELALKRDDAASAFKHVDQARAISQEIADDAGTARAFGVLGVIRIREKEYGDAEWYFKTAAALYEKAGELGKSAPMLEKLGLALYLGGDAAGAHKQFDQALARYTETGRLDAAQKLRELIAELASS